MVKTGAAAEAANPPATSMWTSCFAFASHLWFLNFDLESFSYFIVAQVGTAGLPDWQGIPGSWCCIGSCIIQVTETSQVLWFETSLLNPLFFDGRTRGGLPPSRALPLRLRACQKKSAEKKIGRKCLRPIFFGQLFQRKFVYVLFYVIVSRRKHHALFDVIVLTSTLLRKMFSKF